MRLVHLVHCFFLIADVASEKGWSNNHTATVPFLARFVEAVVGNHKEEVVTNHFAQYILRTLLLAAFDVYDSNMSDLGCASLHDATSLAKDADKWRQMQTIKLVC